jgi:hypothetical protein
LTPVWIFSKQSGVKPPQSKNPLLGKNRSRPLENAPTVALKIKECIIAEHFTPPVSSSYSAFSSRFLHPSSQAPGKLCRYITPCAEKRYIRQPFARQGSVSVELGLMPLLADVLAQQMLPDFSEGERMLLQALEHALIWRPHRSDARFFRNRYDLEWRQREAVRVDKALACFVT